MDASGCIDMLSEWVADGEACARAYSFWRITFYIVSLGGRTIPVYSLVTNLCALKGGLKRVISSSGIWLIRMET